MIPSVKDCKVLVVDTHTEVLQAVSAIFDRYGYPVAKAGNGAMAINFLLGSSFDLVVADFHIPLVSGYELACRIKQTTPYTKVVIMTGNGISQAAEYIDCREIDDWLFKPFGIQALSNVIAIYWLVYTLQMSEQQISLVMLAFWVYSLIWVPILNWISHRFTKKTAWNAAMLVWATTVIVFPVWIITGPGP